MNVSTLSVAVCCFLVCLSGALPITPTSGEATGSTVEARMAPPSGTHRAPCDAGSFAAWLRALPLKDEGAQVHLFDGRPKVDQSAHAAVIDISVGARDLQQCADAIIRLRAEHLFASGRQDEIAFHFTNGFLAEWTRWRKGERIEVTGNSCRWLKRAEPDHSHEELLRFLDIVFTYAGTLSLPGDLRSLASSGPDAAIQAGDVFIQSGSPGHAVIVLDVATDAAGNTYFLLAQSFMPAQEIHILRDPGNPTGSPWFKCGTAGQLVTPHWTFDWSDRHRFNHP